MFTCLILSYSGIYIIAKDIANLFGFSSWIILKLLNLVGKGSIIALVTMIVFAIYDVRTQRYTMLVLSHNIL